jgi:hypothetical protein
LVIFFYVLHAKNVIPYEFFMVPVEMIFVEIERVSCFEIHASYVHHMVFLTPNNSLDIITMLLPSRFLLILILIPCGDDLC